ncbi:hypothetical protein [Rahnella woolbedingensis]|uniref:Uncharacterized protein n=1 Tax=Rahnella woolbedingensis TaxID=1510574 RepID=A0A419NEL3_9GAMM|nr:hypothetical protein [Rahnella woolbedingensis]RJT47213.1 hypothetical protein D6C13_02300 [Rahnella woolbedingensis]
MDTKAAFEKFMLDELDLDVSGFRNEDPETSEEWPYAATNSESSTVITVAFKAWCKSWQASRAAIEIELPELAVDHDERLMVETSVEGAFNLGVIRSRQAITSHGIRIKGKTD